MAKAGTPPIEVGVIIVNYRSADLTLRALASLDRERQNPLLSLRAVVVENASGDHEVLSRAVPERFGHFATYILSAVNGGFGAGNNIGIRQLFESSRPPRYFMFLNPDAEVRPGALVELVKFMEQHPRAGLAGSRIEHPDGSEWPIAFRFPSFLSELEAGATFGPLTRLLEKHVVAMEMGPEPARADWLCGAAFMASRKLLEQAGAFDETYFLYYEEIDLCLRAKKAGFECWHVPQSRVMHIRGQSTGVTVLDEQPRRLPRYWFESRRHYYSTHHGLAYAALADLASLGGSAIGLIKRTLKREPRTPHLLRDLIRESVLLPGARKRISPPRPYMPRPSSLSEAQATAPSAPLN